MNDEQKRAINMVHFYLTNLKYHYDIGSYLCNGRKPNDTNLKSMIWYLETNFPKDMLKHEMGEDEDRVKCPTCEGCGFEEDENYKHSTCSVCLGIGYIAKGAGNE